MTPVEVGKYVRMFQLAAGTRKVKSRMILRDGTYNDSVAELVRSVLPRAMFQMARVRNGYELRWCGNADWRGPLTQRLDGRGDRLTAALARGSVRLEPPYDSLLAESVWAFPIFTRLRLDAGRGTLDATEPPGTYERDGWHDQDEFVNADEREEAGDMATLTARAIIPPQVTAAEIAEVSRQRLEAAAAREGLEPDGIEANVTHATDGARRFAESLARASRR